MELETLLEQLGFAPLEARIYLCLMEGPDQTGYQIAKRLNAYRSSIYTALQNMYEKGMILKCDEGSQSYKPEDPQLLIRRLTERYTAAADQAGMQLKQYRQPVQRELFNVRGRESILIRANQLIAEARHEIYINTDFDLCEFQVSLQNLKQRGGRAVVFSFARLDSTGIDAEFYTHGDSVCDQQRPSRLMLTDGQTTLIADNESRRGDWMGTLTSNRLIASIIAEHIHNDIYLLKLKQRFGTGLIDDNILIHTRQEQRHD